MQQTFSPGFTILWSLTLELLVCFMPAVSFSLTPFLFPPLLLMQPASSSNLPLAWNGCGGQCQLQNAQHTFFFFSFLLENMLRISVTDMLFDCHINPGICDWLAEGKRCICHHSRFIVKQGVDWFFPWLLLCGRLVILLFLVRTTDNKSQSAK